ncbi:hypothetical protein P153DRAFT_400268 [Dothidotthia symphoricarpi CBS 119687]|uniref:Uncharacterized protein n=1 Tax=Dothidotthia symphoricarpi CBS 119687 TaxID=1392245 RepID=A0A6A6A2N3_9PLEO|nr:uncharacterized protein P153DRAFT_400268 [Dothidotthia symphoricarpi CBS 119687]KAF2125455.1 hypothetical protein P153DRAFT_400268 [Dothidotthia symphoricarpi CBS 119687]
MYGAQSGQHSLRGLGQKANQILLTHGMGETGGEERAAGCHSLGSVVEREESVCQLDGVCGQWPLGAEQTVCYESRLHFRGRGELEQGRVREKARASFVAVKGRQSLLTRQVRPKLPNVTAPAVAGLARGKRGELLSSQPCPAQPVLASILRLAAVWSDSYHVL